MNEREEHSAGGKGFRARLAALKSRLERSALRKVAGQSARQCSSRAGLTLVELAIVLLVLGIIMGIVFMNLDTSLIGKAEATKIRAQAQTVGLAIITYEREVRQLEDRESLEVLAKRSSEHPGWRPEKAAALQDPWKKFFVIRVSESGEKEVWSLGADGTEGGSGKNADFCISNESTWPAWLKGGK